MTQRTFRIGVSCGLGAFIGSLVALELGVYLWWLGMIAGGLVGYLSYEFKAVLVAAPKAWRATSTWSPNWTVWRRTLGVITALTLVSSFPGIVVMSSVIWLLKAFPPTRPVSTISDWFTLGVLFATVNLIITVIILATTRTESYEKLWRIAWRVNAITLVPWTLYGLAWLTWRLVRLSPRALCWLFITMPLTLSRFLKYLFLFIHSEERLLCGMDAAVGAAIGYFAGNAMIGAAGGFAFGLLNYELLSKWLLKNAIAQLRSS